jgi:hypothetical protein
VDSTTTRFTKPRGSRLLLWRSVQTKGRAALDELGKNCASGVDILLG